MTMTDMYLEAKKSLVDGTNYEETTICEKIRAMIPEISKLCHDDFVHVAFHVGRWKNAHTIHEWFVDYVQNERADTDGLYVSREDLLELLKYCKTTISENVQSSQDDASLRILEEANDTIKIVNKALQLDDEWSLYYYAGWKKHASILTKY